MAGYLQTIARALEKGSGSGTSVVGSSGSVANTATGATLPAAVGKTTYITGFEITGAGATAASVITVTITGTSGPSTPTYLLTIPAGATTGITPLQVEFPQPIPASAQNTAIVVNLPAFGAGNTNACATAHGYQL